MGMGKHFSSCKNVERHEWARVLEERTPFSSVGCMCCGHTHTHTHMLAVLECAHVPGGNLNKKMEREREKKEKKNATTGLLLRHRHLSHSFRKVSHFNGRVNMFAYQANELSATAKPMFCHFDVRLHAHGTRHTEPLLLARVLASAGGALNCT